MNEETMKQWNALIVEYNKRSEEIIIAASNEANALDVAYRKAKADREARKYEFIQKLKAEQRIATETYLEEKRQIKIRTSQAKRYLEAKRQEAYLKFKLEHQDENAWII